MNTNPKTTIVKTPCYNCEDRHACCWDNCERYQEWKAKKEEAKKSDIGDRIAESYLAKKNQKLKNRRENKKLK
jgi:hypothetical protein